MKQVMKIIGQILLIPLIFYSMVNVMGFMIGSISANDGVSFDNPYHNQRCVTEFPRRVERFIPAYALGCWMFGIDGGAWRMLPVDNAAGLNDLQNMPYKEGKDCNEK